MKRILVILGACVLVAVGIIYISIPGTINVSRVMPLGCPEKAAERVFGKSSYWPAWWPSAITSGAPVQLGGIGFRLNRKIADNIEVVIEEGADTISSLVNIMPVNTDSCSLVWQCRVNAGNSPVSRLQGYFKAGRIKQQMDAITIALGAYVSDQKNLYGLTITQEKVVDTLLVTLRKDFSTYPSTRDIYGLIGSLEAYVAAKQAKATNPPMMHMDVVSDSQYSVMVAIPVDRDMGNQGDIQVKRMPRGNILVSNDITGGTAAVDHAFESMNNYVNDYQRISPGLSFASLITNRIQEPDSTKWVTKVYFPVF